MLVVGLTGGIASGKTAAADAFARLGVSVVDTDVLAREVVAPGSAGLAEIVDAFGAGVLGPDGGLDRARLRQRVFADDAALARLEAITHPRIEALTRERLAESRGPYAILVVPLLVEKGWQHLVDRVLVVDTDVATQRQRLMNRDRIDRDAADAMLRRQTDRASRVAAADDLIENNGDRATLEAAVAELDRRYRALADQASWCPRDPG